MLNLDFYYIDCEDKDLRDKMFITELVVQYLRLIR